MHCRPGFRSHLELAEVYASSDVHVSASEFETLGNTVLEAHACGVPVVVPRTQGFLDTVLDGENGLLFAPGDARSAAEKVGLLMRDPELRRTMGAKGVLAVSNRAVSTVVEELLGWYRRGQRNRRSTGWMVLALRSLLLLGSTALSIFCFSVYSLVMTLLSAVGAKSQSR